MLGELVRQPVSAGDYIPHGLPMRVVDQLLSVKNKVAKVTAKITADHLFLRDDGTLEECVFVEMIAQAIATGVGYEELLEGNGRQEGFLLGAKNIEVFSPACVGDELLITAWEYAKFGDIGVVEGTVMRGETLLARGEIKVLQMSTQGTEVKA